MRIGLDPTIRINDTKQQRQIKSKQIQTRVVREVTLITGTYKLTRLWWLPYIILVTIYEWPHTDTEYSIKKCLHLVTILFNNHVVGWSVCVRSAYTLFSIWNVK